MLKLRLAKFYVFFVFRSGPWFDLHRLMKKVFYVKKLKRDQLKKKMGRSPGLVVMGGDSCSKGRDFESRHHILGGHGVFHIYLL